MVNGLKKMGGPNFFGDGVHKKTSQEWQNAAQRSYHWLARCQNVLTQRPFKNVFF